MAIVDLNVLVSGFLRHAARQPAPRVYLEDLHAKAIAAVAAGDQFVVTTGFDGQASTFERKFPSQDLLTVMETCLTRLDAEEAGDETSGSVRVGAFNCRRSEWG